MQIINLFIISLTINFTPLSIYR